MKRILEKSLARECPVSITEIAVQNGYSNAGCIRLEFPELCRSIGRKIAQLKKAEMNANGEVMRARLRQVKWPAGWVSRVRVFWRGIFLVYTRRFLREEKPTKRHKECSYTLT